jgi:hypothetical protein
MIRLPVLLAAALAAPLPLSAAPVEHATYHSGGGLTALIHDGVELPVRGEFVVTFEGGVHATLQPHDQRSPITREDGRLHWEGVTTFPNGGQARFDAVWTETDGTVSLAGRVTSGAPAQPGTPAPRWPLLVESVDYVLDVPRETFAGGRLEPSGRTIPTANEGNVLVYDDTTAALAFADAARNWRLALALDQPRRVTITDRWDTDGRSYRVRLQLGGGVWPAGETWKFGLALTLTGTAHADAAHLTVDPADSRYAFDGFGANYCFATATPAADYLLDHLKQTWTRLELKAQAWDAERHTQPGAALTRDFQLMQRVQKTGGPWILSLWRLPERFYTDANQKPPFTFGRQIAPERWPGLLELIGSYLTYLKKNYGAEPDYFSFNEPDLGVSVGFSAEAHRDAIKRLGAHFASLGLKTKLLLGDTANPRDSHRYVLPAAADAEALRHAGALSVHSWGGGTPAQYQAWSDVAAWLRRPLIVGEAGTDPGSYRNRMFDSYAYGLGEMRQYQELLRDLHPQAILFWQFTEDYGLVHVAPDGSVEPTGRFHLMKHFTNLTPFHSRVLASTSDRPDVLVSAFARDAVLTIHILNTGAARDAVLAGVPAGPWRIVATTETAGFAEGGSIELSADRPLPLPARSLTTLVRGQP